MSGLSLIQCPITRKPLRLVRPDELLLLQERGRESGLCNALGRAVSFPIECGYVSEAAGCFFPIVNGVAWLVAEDAIALEGPTR